MSYPFSRNLVQFEECKRAILVLSGEWHESEPEPESRRALEEAALPQRERLQSFVVQRNAAQPTVCASNIVAVNHGQEQSAAGPYHTDNAEAYFSLFKRGMKGTTCIAARSTFTDIWQNSISGIPTVLHVIARRTIAHQ